MSLELSHVGKSYDAVKALEDVNLTIGNGEFIAILGPSGCGKTTLLKSIAGFIAPSEGSISLEGKVYSDQRNMVPVEARDLGMVFQSFALWPHMTVRQHVEFPLASQKYKHMTAEAKHKAVEEAIASTGLAAMADRLPGELSGGQKQRVSLARAIVGKPSLLLMDEPLSALDAELRIEMRRVIQDIHNLTGATVVYVTHDQNEAMAMADRIVIMRSGKIEQVGTPEDIYRNPQTLFVATFVSKCNLLPGRWDQEGFTVEKTQLRLPAGSVAPAFRQAEVYPIRPEELRLTTNQHGIRGVIVNRQYNGREHHYLVKFADQLFTVYDNSSFVYPKGAEIFMESAR